MPGLQYIGQYAPSRARLTGFFSLLAKRNLGISCVSILKRALCFTNFVKVMVNW